MKVLHRLQTGVTAIGVALLFVMTSAPLAWAQGSPLFTKADALDSVDRLDPGQIGLSGDTAVLGGDGTARVFERAAGQDLWAEGPPLSASDDTPGFGVSVATDGNTIVVGATEAAFVFRRGSAGWLEVARLTGGVNVQTFGRAVGVSGSTVIIGAPTPNRDGSLRGQGRVYVFEESGTQEWTEVALLNGREHPLPNRVDRFGHSISIDADTIVVGAHSPRGILIDASTPLGYVFGRDQGGTGAWGLITEITLLPPPVTQFFDAIEPQVAISGDTIVMGSFRPATARIFERNLGGPDAWGLRTSLASIDGTSQTSHVSISGDRVFVTRPGAASVFARNQGGHDAWGEAARVPLPAAVRMGAIDGDTLIAANASVNSSDVYVADTDRDGIRDGIDPCPNDPLNNTAGSCARDSGGTPVLDDYVTADNVEVVSYGNPFVIRATFTNTTDAAISNPFFEVTYLSAGNELLNADAGPSGTGATLTADVGDGVLSPGESMTVLFDIGLNSSDAFGLLVSLHGTTD